MISRHRIKVIAAATTVIVSLVAVGAYARCTGGSCPPPVNFPCTPTSFNPTNPAASGYQLVQSDNFASVGTSTIDMANTGNPGFHWYLRKPFGYTTEPSTDFTTDANSLIMTASVNTAGINLTTAYPNGSAANGLSWVGNAFGSGGYFEIKMAFDGPTVQACAATCGNPSFWGMGVSHWANVGGDQWPGQAAGFTHYIEDDFFEWDTSGFAINKWGSGIWDWYGTYNVTCSGFCGILNDGRTGANGYNNIFLGSNSGGAITWNNSTYHTLGNLWIAGNAANSFAGSRTIYFDGLLASSNGAPGNPTVNWTTTAMPAPSGTGGNGGVGSTPQLWSVHDLDSIVVNLGGPIGVPFHIAYVNVWQIPGCGTVAH